MISSIAKFQDRTSKCKKCKKCIHTLHRMTCGLTWYKLITNQTSIKKCKQFRNRTKYYDTGGL